VGGRPYGMCRPALIFAEGADKPPHHDTLRSRADVCALAAGRMSPLFQELDYRPTPIGELSLRKRRDLTSGDDVYEIKLGDAFLMSSQFTVSEIALARLALAELDGRDLDVVVGGLGLGYTAQAVLEHDAVGSLLVVEMLDAVLDWHRSAVLPLGHVLTSDARCRLVSGDFFAMSGGPAGFDANAPGRLFDAILVDIDHSPDMILDARSRPFYQPQGLQAARRHLRDGGIFALWSNDRPDAAFTSRLSDVFTEAWAAPVTFHNPLQNRDTVQTIYLARSGARPGEAAR
jgi:spermidine synthase